MSSADLPLFRPLPFLSNPHVQTVIGHFAGWAPNRLPAQTSLVPLPDGDAVALHETAPKEWTPGGDCALLVHGLGGDHKSKYLIRVARRLMAEGVRVYRMDMRGAGASAPHSRKLYNAACSADARAAFLAVHEQNPASRIFLLGFSLGGNIALKLAAEAADEPLPNLAGVVGVNAPIDLLRCHNLILRYPFYDRFYVRNLVRQVNNHGRLHGIEVPRWDSPMTLRRFDDLYTAPLGGYEHALDYYEKASSFKLIPRIEAPTFLLTSRDDPFVCWTPYAELPRQSHHFLHIARGGGHLGFLGPDGRGGVRWAETQVVDWIVDQRRRSA